METTIEKTDKRTKEYKQSKESNIHPNLAALIEAGIPLEYVICRDTVRSSGVPEKAFYSPKAKRNGVFPTTIKTRLADLWLVPGGSIVIKCSETFITMTSTANAFDFKPLPLFV